MTSSYNLVVESSGHDDHLDLGAKGETIVKGDSQVSGTRWRTAQLSR